MDILRLLLDTWPPSINVKSAVLEHMDHFDAPGGGLLPLHVLLQNQKFTLESMTTVIEASLNSVKVKTTVLKDLSGNETGGGELPLHLLLKHHSLTAAWYR